ncbi:MAG: PAS domain-containing protein [Parvibaculum sp.]|nr:PAS domain-containing protein [Parvibaculum sp.]
MSIRSAIMESDAPACPARSAKSIAFQEAWAGIPKSALIPDKADFRPERLKNFLNDIYLVELHQEAERRLLFRLAGQSVRDGLGIEMRGLNYVDFVPPEHRASAGISMRKMFGPVPCGRWVRKEVVHRDGFREPIELTQMPMTDLAGGGWLVIGIVEGFGENRAHAEADEGKFRFESFDAEYFIDIGAGLPDEA